MTHPEFYNDPISVTAIIGLDGQTQPTRLTWRGVHFNLVSVGRQWESESGRHILVEASDGARFELELSRSELVWYLRRLWPVSLAA